MDFINQLGLGEVMGPLLGFALVSAFLFLAFTPLIIASNGRSPTLVAWLSAVLGIGGGGIVLFGSLGPSFVGSIIMMFGAVAWLSGLLCGLAAFLDACMKKHLEDAVFRLVHSDARNLKVPENLPKKKAEPAST